MNTRLLTARMRLGFQPAADVGIGSGTLRSSAPASSGRGPATLEQMQAELNRIRANAEEGARSNAELARIARGLQDHNSALDRAARAYRDGFEAEATEHAEALNAMAGLIQSAVEILNSALGKDSPILSKIAEALEGMEDVRQFLAGIGDKELPSIELRSTAPALPIGKIESTPEEMADEIIELIDRQAGALYGETHEEVSRAVLESIDVIRSRTDLVMGEDLVRQTLHAVRTQEGTDVHKAFWRVIRAASIVSSDRDISNPIGYEYMSGLSCRIWRAGTPKADGSVRFGLAKRKVVQTTDAEGAKAYYDFSGPPVDARAMEYMMGFLQSMRAGKFDAEGQAGSEAASQVINRLLVHRQFLRGQGDDQLEFHLFTKDVVPQGLVDAVYDLFEPDSFSLAVVRNMFSPDIVMLYSSDMQRDIDTDANAPVPPDPEPEAAAPPPPPQPEADTRWRDLSDKMVSRRLNVLLKEHASKKFVWTGKKFQDITIADIKKVTAAMRGNKAVRQHPDFIGMLDDFERDYTEDALRVSKDRGPNKPLGRFMEIVKYYIWITDPQVREKVSGKR